MKLEPRLRDDTEDVIVRFIRDKVDQGGLKGVIVAVSGGLDSAVVLALCVKALGAGKVAAFFLPDDDTPSSEGSDAGALCKKLGVTLRKLGIGGLARSVSSALGTQNPQVVGNIKARLRMLIVYAEANATGKMVVGTGNKSELLTGYFTKHGDGGVDINPIGDLYKTQVRQLARRLDIPERIIGKKPTAGLVKGQTDEGDLGISYEMLDKVLMGIEYGLGPKLIAAKSGAPVRGVERINDLVERNAHKRRLPLIPKLGLRTVGCDWRE